jgi:protein phosphatase
MMSTRDPLPNVSRTDIGRRRSENQDNLGAWRHEDGRHLLLVADGMGGHRGGATASQIAVRTFREIFDASAMEDDAEDLLHSAFAEANHHIHTSSRQDLALSGMGTTGVALLVYESGEAFIGHVGDSRAYRLRRGTLECLTRDHNVRNQLVDRNGFSEAEASQIPDAEALVRALGPSAEVEAEIHRITLEEGDLFLLCSDGLYGVVPEASIVETLLHYSAYNAVEMLVNEANQRGGPDNITVQVATWQPSAVAAAPEPSRRAAAAARAERTLPGLTTAPAEPPPFPASPRAAVPPPPPVETRVEPPPRRRGRLGWAIPAAGVGATAAAALMLALVIGHMQGALDGGSPPPDGGASTEALQVAPAETPAQAPVVAAPTAPASKPRSPGQRPATPPAGDARRDSASPTEPSRTAERARESASSGTNNLPPATAEPALPASPSDAPAASAGMQSGAFAGAEQEPAPGSNALAPQAVASAAPSETPAHVPDGAAPTPSPAREGLPASEPSAEPPAGADAGRESASIAAVAAKPATAALPSPAASAEPSLGAATGPGPIQPAERRRVVALLEKFEASYASCDLLAMSELASPLAMFRARKKCEAAAAVNVSLVPDLSTLRAGTDGELEIDIEEKIDGEVTALRAHLARSQDEAKQILDLAPPSLSRGARMNRVIEATTESSPGRDTP